jgi:hypothetical protein
MLWRILFVLLSLRLLMPPGICACKLSSPAAKLLAAAFGGTPVSLPGDSTEDDRDHSPGCPASDLAQGMGVAPPSGPGNLDLASAPHSDLAPAPLLVSLSPGAGPAEPLFGALDDPLFLTHCALLI